jgi:competence protein ComEC
MTPPFVPLALAWLVGLWVAEWVALPFLVWLGLSALSIAALVGWFWTHSAILRPYIHHTPVIGLVMVVFLVGGASRAVYALERAETLATYNDSGMVSLIGVVDRYPEERGTHTAYVVAAEMVYPADAPQGIPVNGLLIVNLPPHPAYTYGDRIRLTGRLETPTRSPEFDYRAYLEIQGIRSIFRPGESVLMAQQQGAPLFQALHRIRAHAEQTVQSLLPEPHASLLNGILLGLNGAIPDSVQEAFNATGTTHVLVISGSNFSVLVATIGYLAQKGLGRRRGVVVTLIIIGLYALLVGGDPPVMRAAIMGSLVLVAYFTGRSADALNLLGVAVVGFTWLNPAQRADVGFQLSVLATLGLILLIPVLSQATAFLLEKVRLSLSVQQSVLKVITEFLLLSLAAQIITTPLIVGTFGRLSLVSLFTNLLIVPVQPLIMQSGALATMLGMIAPPLGQIVAVLPYLGLAWTLTIVEWTARFPFASVAIGPFVPEQVWTVYALIGFGIRFMTLPTSPKPASPFDAPALFGLTRRTVLIWAGLLLIAILPWWLGRQRPDGLLHLYMFDVGQGDALMVVAPDGRQMLIDGGEEPSLLLREVGEVMPFWDKTIELVVVTHPDQDHLGGLPDLLARYDVQLILESGTVGDTNLYTGWQSAVAEEGIAPVVVQAGQQLDMGQGLTVEILAPYGTSFEDTNQNSVVLEVRYGDFCALLTGDIEIESEQRLLADNALDPCQVLKVAHHGSDSSTSEGFLEQVMPTYALISSGSGNQFGHPTPSVLERLEERGVRIFRTDQQGTIHLYTDGASLWVESER